MGVRPREESRAQASASESPPPRTHLRLRRSAAKGTQSSPTGGRDLGSAPTLSLPLMARHAHKLVHELAHAFSLKSKSVGNGTARFSKLVRGMFDGVRVDEWNVARIWSSCRRRMGAVVQWEKMEFCLLSRCNYYRADEIVILRRAVLPQNKTKTQDLSPEIAPIHLLSFYFANSPWKTQISEDDVDETVRSESE
ncbi:hypothetical protein EDB89DRAFT_2000225 [Lactarius sanguifluus]|nr:hypothetical protein EDB89DRAFT_2000225 [Lactarius sanguifluus]